MMRIVGPVRTLPPSEFQRWSELTGEALERIIAERAILQQVYDRNRIDVVYDLTADELWEMATGAARHFGLI